MGSSVEEAIAIIGMGCRFPGGASSPGKFWELLIDGRSAWTEFPADRINVEGFYHPSSSRSDSFDFKGAHFIREDIKAFDPKFFGISDKEANSIDPQQRILLEVSYEALENAGLKRADLRGSRTCVHVGSFVKDYEQISMRDSQTTPPDCATGNSIAIMANRISYTFDLRGTSQTIDTGCSASLVSLHQGVNNLRSCQSDMAIVGGAGLMLTPSTIMPMTSLGFLSADGKCYTFDSRANGYGRGEGVGIVILKRLKDALRDGDPIRAVIRGTASNQDGRTPGITVPNPDAQMDCIREAYRNAGLDVMDTTYVECHGTGTPVGDWRELKAVGAAVSRGRKDPVVVGSAKPNIGHLEGAAGVAGLIRAVLILENDRIPAHINFKQWNPDILHQEWGVRVVTQKGGEPFPRREDSRTRRVSVNCFGFGGTNAHAVVQDTESCLGSWGLHTPWVRSTIPSPPNEAAIHSTPTLERFSSSTTAATLVGTSPLTPIPAVHPQHLFLFSSFHAKGLKETVESYSNYLNKTSVDYERFASLSYTLAARREAFDNRVAFVAGDTEKLGQMLQNYLSGTHKIPSRKSPPRIALVFGGQGTQWDGMFDHELKTWRPFRESIEAAAFFFRTLGGNDELEAHLGTMMGERPDIDRPELAQPLSTAMQVALVDLLRAAGILNTNQGSKKKYDGVVAVCGFSSGEMAAAYAAGHISRETAWALSFYRGRAVAKAPGKGCMLAVSIPTQDAEVVIKQITVRDGSYACVSCHTSNDSCTISGDEDAIVAIREHLLQRQVRCKMLSVQTAYHSKRMELVATDYKHLIEGLNLAQDTHSNVTMYSTVTGLPICSSNDLTAAYWVENLIKPVQFAQAYSVMLCSCSAAVDVVVELSPQIQLAAACTAMAQDNKGFRGVFSLTGKKRDDEKNGQAARVLDVLGRLWALGHNHVKLDWTWQDDVHVLNDLPTYRWNHSRTYWAESRLSREHRLRMFGSRDLLGSPTADSIVPLEPRWRGFFRVGELPWLRDHQVRGVMVYPAAGLVTMAVEAARQLVAVAGSASCTSVIRSIHVLELDIKAPMLIPDDSQDENSTGGLEHMMSARRTEANVEAQQKVTSWSYNFSIYTRRDSDLSHTKNATGKFVVRFQSDMIPEATAASEPIQQTAMTTTTPGFCFYEGLRTIGLHFGPTFRNVQFVETANNRQLLEKGGHDLDKALTPSAVTLVKVPDTRSCMPAHFEFDHVIHPATLDSLIHGALVLGDASRLMLPVKISAVHFSGAFINDPLRNQAGRKLRCEIQITHATDGNRVSNDYKVRFCEDRRQSQPAIVLEDVQVLAAEHGTIAEGSFLPDHRHLCSELVWRQDVDYTEFQCLEQWLPLLGHKHAGTRVLQIGSDPETAGIISGRFGDSSTSQPSVYVLADADESEVLETAKDSSFDGVFRTAPLSGLLQDGTQFDLVVAEADRVAAHALLKLVGTRGFLLVTTRPTATAGALANFGSSCETQGFRFSGRATHAVCGDMMLYRFPAESTTSLMDSIPATPFPNRKRRVYVLISDETCSANSFKTAHDLLPGVSNNFYSQRSIELIPRGLSWLDTYDTLEANHSMPIISLLEVESELVYDIATRPTGKTTYIRIQKLLRHARKLLWVTFGRPEHATFHGWARTVRSEDTSKQVWTVDVTAKTDTATRSPWGRAVLEILFSGMLMEKSCDRPLDVEYKVEFMRGHNAAKVLVPRLMPMEKINDVIENGGAAKHAALKPDSRGLYVIAGAGSLGLDIAEWLASKGARHIALLSRSPAHKTREWEARLEKAAGAPAYVLGVQLDLNDKDRLFQVMAELQANRPIKGVVHAGGVLSDAPYTTMTFEQWKSATLVKTLGSRNLADTVVANCPSAEFLVFLSSASGVIGNRGQANYAAGNCFQDALARNLDGKNGLRVSSLDLGPIIGTGMVTEEVMEVLRGAGFFGIRRCDFTTVLEAAITEPESLASAAQIVLGVGTGGLIAQNRPADPFWARTALYAHLNRIDAPATSPLNGTSISATNNEDLRPLLRAAPTLDQALSQIMIPAFARALASVVPNLRPEDVDPHSTPAELQSDSMRGVHVENWLRRAVGVGVGAGRINQMAVGATCEEVLVKGRFF